MRMGVGTSLSNGQNEPVGTGTLVPPQLPAGPAIWFGATRMPLANVTLHGLPTGTPEDCLQGGLIMGTPPLLFSPTRTSAMTAPPRGSWPCVMVTLGPRPLGHADTPPRGVSFPDNNLLPRDSRPDFRPPLWTRPASSRAAGGRTHLALENTLWNGNGSNQQTVHVS